MASPTARPLSFINVSGFSSVTRAVPMEPSQTSALNFFRQGEKPCSRAMRSTAMKPMLWRLPEYLSPGLPRPTKSVIADPLQC